jgi:Uncharacterized conserved protein
MLSARAADGRRQLLFAEEGRFLQLDLIGGTAAFPSPPLSIPLSTTISSGQWQGLRQVADLLAHGHLRPPFHPPPGCARRLVLLLRALDGHLAGASHRRIAVALWGERRAAEEWSDPRRNLRDRVRRAVQRGRTLMAGGYRRFLR